MSGLLSLDQATVTGWAWCDPGGEPQWGHQRMGRRMGADDGEIFFAFRRFLMTKIISLRPDHIVFEASGTPQPNRSDEAKPINHYSLRRGYGFVAYVTGISEEFQIPYAEMQTGKATKFFTGRGRYPGRNSTEKSRAKKDATIAAALARGWHATADEADALAILMCREFELYPEASLKRGRFFKTPSGPLFKRADVAESGVFVRDLT